MRIQYPVVHTDRNTVPELDKIAPAIAIGCQYAAGCPYQRIDFSSGTAAHQQHIRFAAFNSVDQFIQLIQCQRVSCCR
jgi:hypothetical protein